jgi:predicted alpha/beta hydrolase family esterase
MPTPFSPRYGEWKAEFERQAVDEDTILVGHSCGAGFLVRWLSESDTVVKKLVLVAPWLDPEHEEGDLFDFAINTALEMRTKSGIDVLYSTNDDDQVQSTLDLLRKHLPTSRYHEFVDYGHFCLRDMGTREFPELLNFCLPPKVAS